MESNKKLNKYSLDILKKISNKPINNICNNNSIEHIFDIYQNFLTNIILAVESSAFKLCNIINKNNNLYYKTTFGLTNNLLTEYFNKLYHSCEFNEDKYTHDTFQKLKTISNKEPYFHIYLMFEIIKDIYLNLNRLKFNIDDIDKYLKSVEEEVYDQIYINKFEIIQSYITNKNNIIKYNKDINPFIFNLSTYDTNIQDIVFTNDIVLTNDS
jgi:hypothetical protein